MEKKKITSMQVAEHLLKGVLPQNYKLEWDKEPGYELWGDIKCYGITWHQLQRIDELGFYLGSINHFTNYMSIRFRIYE